MNKAGVKTNQDHQILVLLLWDMHDHLWALNRGNSHFWRLSKCLPTDTVSSALQTIWNVPYSFAHSPLFFPPAPEEMPLSRHKDGGHAVLQSHSPPLCPPGAVSQRAVPPSRSCPTERSEVITLRLLYCQMAQKGIALHVAAVMPMEAGLHPWTQLNPRQGQQNFHFNT